FRGGRDERPNGGLDKGRRSRVGDGEGGGSWEEPCERVLRQGSPPAAARASMAAREKPMPPPERATVRSLDALTLATNDMARAVAFYRALGFALDYGGEAADFTSFRIGAEAHLNLIAA